MKHLALVLSLAKRAILRSLSIGNAVGYTIDNRQRLTRFRDDPTAG